MALWIDGKKLLFIGASGLQYRPAIECTLPLVIVEPLVRKFFETRNARVDKNLLPSQLSFTRGSRWIGRLSWLLVLPETWPFQRISVSFYEQGESSTVNIDYDVWMFFLVIIAPNQLEKEIFQLRAQLAAADVA